MSARWHEKKKKKQLPHAFIKEIRAYVEENEP